MSRKRSANESNSLDKQTFKVGDRMHCRWRNRQDRMIEHWPWSTNKCLDSPCEIIETRYNEETHKNEYYVHYIECMFLCFYSSFLTFSQQTTR
jgi:hypothetical protein